MPLAVEADLDAAMRQALRVQSPGDARKIEHIDGALLEHAGTNAAEHVLRRALLENDGIDAGLVQQLPEQQPGRPGSDDRDLCSHAVPSRLDLRQNAPRPQRRWRWKKSQHFLDFSQALGPTKALASASETRAGANVARRSIPQYFLYGEASQDVDERFLHVESIAERSRLHDWTIRPHAHRDLHHLLLVTARRRSVSCRRRSNMCSRPSPDQRSALMRPWIRVRRRGPTAGSSRPQAPCSGALHANIRELDACVRGRERDLAADRRRPRNGSWFDSLVGEFRGNLPARRAAAESWLMAIVVAALRRKLELAPEAARTPSADSQLAAKYRALVEAHFRTQMSIADYAQRLCISPERLRLACVRTHCELAARAAQCPPPARSEAHSALHEHEHRADRGDLRLHRPRVFLAFLREKHGQVGEGISVAEMNPLRNVARLRA